MSTKLEIDTKTFLRFWLVPVVIVLVFFLIMRAWTGLLIVAASVFLAIALSPLAKKLDSLIKTDKHKNLSSIIAVVIVVLGIIAIFAIVSPVIIDQLSKFLGTAPAELSNFLNNVDLSGIEKFLGSSDLKADILNTVDTFSATLRSNLSSLALSSISAISNVLTSTIFIIVLTILFMLQGPSIVNSFWQTIEGHDKSFSKSRSTVIRRTSERMAKVVSTYVSRQMLIAVVDGCVAGLLVLVLSLFTPVDTSLAVPAGLISAICYLIPMFGPIISSVLNSLFIFIASPLAALIYLVLYVIYAQIEANIISPKIQGKGLGLSPLIILIAITIGVYAFGLIGCLISIPIAGCIKVIIEEYPNFRKCVEHEKRS